MRTILPEPPKPSDPRFIDWLYRLWKRVTSTSSGELGLGTMADQDADAVAITGGSATLDTLTLNGPIAITDHATDHRDTLSVSRSYTDGPTYIYAQNCYLRPTHATNGVRYSFAVGAYVTPIANTGATNSGYSRAFDGLALRNYVSVDSDDDGTVTIITGMSLGVGHGNGNVSANPITTTLYGISELIHKHTGTITNAYGVYISTIGSGGTIGTLKGIALAINSADATTAYGFYSGGTAQNHFSGDVNIFGAGKLGYATGSGGTVAQSTSRTTGVTLNKTNGAITLASAAGSATWQSFTLTNSTIAATDTVRVCQKSGTDLYQIHVTAVAAGSCQITYATTGGTTTEQPVFNFAVIKGVTS